MLRELRLPDGGFASAQDADTDGVEGLTYTWTPGGGRARGAARSRSRTAASSSGASSTTSCARGCSRSASSAPAARSRRQGDRLLERPRACGARRGGTAARRGPTSSTTAARCAEFLLGPLSDGDGRLLPHAGATAAPAAPATSTTTRTSRNGLYELHVATGELRWLEEARRLALLAVELFGDDAARRLLPRARGRRAARRAQEGPRRPPDSRRATRCSRTCSCGWRGSTGDDELERRAVGVFRLLAERARARRRPRSAWALCALDLHLSPPRELADHRTAGQRGRPRGAARRSSRTRSSPSARPRPSRCSRGRVSWTACRPSTLRALRLQSSL